MTEPVFQEESFEAVLPELQAHWHAHWLETQREHDTMPLDVDLEAYRFMEGTGNLSVVTVRVDGQLVGYCSSFMHQHLKSKEVRCAVMDAYYLHPDYRGMGYGKQLFAAVHTCLKARGVQRLFGDTKAWADLSVMFERDGWLCTGKTFTKWIGD